MISVPGKAGKLTFVTSARSYGEGGRADGPFVSARIEIDERELAAMIRNAHRNKTKRSQDGPITVEALRV